MVIAVLVAQGLTLLLAASQGRGTGILVMDKVGHLKEVMAHFKENVHCAKKNISFQTVLS